MSKLLLEYEKALRNRKFNAAIDIEKRFIEKANEYGTFAGRDYWLELLTNASL